jgi:hypothetical protein
VVSYSKNPAANNLNKRKRSLVMINTLTFVNTRDELKELFGSHKEYLKYCVPIQYWTYVFKIPHKLTNMDVLNTLIKDGFRTHILLTKFIDSKKQFLDDSAMKDIETFGLKRYTIYLMSQESIKYFKEKYLN